MVQADATALTAALKKLLFEGKATTQEEICIALERQGFKINQSSVSRLLRKVKAVKVENEKGESIYSLAREPFPLVMTKHLEHLVLEIVANETTVVITTTPGCASMIARMLDYKKSTSEVLGTIAGDDTVFVCPKSIKRMPRLLEEIRRLLIPEH